MQGPSSKPSAPRPCFAKSGRSIIQQVTELIHKQRLAQQAITTTVQPDSATFDNVLLPLAHAANATALDAGILIFLQDVSSDPDIRHASAQAQHMLNDFDLETLTNPLLFALIERVWQNKDAFNLDPESNQLLAKQYKARIRCGLGLGDQSQYQRFREIQQRLNHLKVEFRSNLADAQADIWVAHDELHGVPRDAVSALRRDEITGKLCLSTAKHLLAVLRYATNAETRKQIYIAHENKCPQNVPLFREIVMLRNEAARLLGYKNHASFSIEDKMTKTPQVVDKFLEALRTGLHDSGQGDKELRALKSLKKEDVESKGELYDGYYFWWDYTYYNRIMLEKHHNIDQRTISEYFSVEATIQAMLDTFAQLFSLVFTKLGNTEIDVPSAMSHMTWHEDVIIFSVWDSDTVGGQFVGHLYLDIFARQDKYGNSSCFNLRPGCTSADGIRQYPATALLCSFSTPCPTTSKPSLLQHSEVVTLFHELGHSIHDLVSKTKYAKFHGINVAVDFGEAPSQMLENWCWDRSTLKTFGRHYSYLEPWASNYSGTTRPSERLPDKIIDALVAAKLVNHALFSSRQLHIASFDMMVYAPDCRDPANDFDFTVEYNRSRKEVTNIDGPEVLNGGDYRWGHGFANLGPLISEYDAGYYSYLSSNVYAMDIFNNFFKDNLTNIEEGLRYRRVLLEKGGSQEEMKTLGEYLGREPNPEAFYQELGIGTRGENNAECSK